MLHWVHSVFFQLPAAVGPIHVAAAERELLGLQPDDVVVLGAPSFPVRLGLLPRPARLLSWLPEVVERARAVGWPALLLPGPDPAAIALAAGAGATGLLAVSRGTLDLGGGAWWSVGGVEHLPPRELEALSRLVGRAPGALPRAEFAEPVIRALRARLGPGHLVSERGALRFRALPGPSTPAPPSARAPLALGTSAVDLDGLRLLHPDREVTLTAREGRAVAVLLAVPGVADRSALASALGLRGDTRRLDLAVHRLRAKLAPLRLEVVRGRGYRLHRPIATAGGASGPEPDPDLERVGAAMGGRLVTVVGPCGVGKSELLARAAGQAGAERLDLHGAPPEVVARVLGRRARGGLVVVDGLDDAARFCAQLRSALDRGARLLVGARAPSGLDGERVVALQPWSPEAIEARWPGRAGAADGLPLAAVDPEGFAERLAAVPEATADALRALSVYAGPFDDADAAAAGCRLAPSDLARLGWLRGPRWRLPTPVRDALRRRWSTHDHDRHGREAARRAQAALDRRPFRLEPLADAAPDLRDAHRATGDPRLAALRAHVDAELGERDPGTAAWLSAAVQQASEPALRSRLLASLATAGPEVDLPSLEAAVALAEGEERLERLLELAWYLRGRGREAEAEAALAEAEAALALQPPHAWLYCRAELAVVRRGAGSDPAAALATFTELLGRMEVARWSREDFPAGHRRTEAARRQLFEFLGRSLRALGREVEAEVAYRAADELYPHPGGQASVQVALGDLAASALRWDEAEARYQRAEAAATRTGFQGWAILALVRRAATWAIRGEPDRGDVLLARARALSGWTRVLRRELAVSEGWRAAARGRPEDLPASESDAEVLLAALADAALVVRARRAGADAPEALARCASRLEAVPPSSRSHLRALLERSWIPGDGEG